MEEHSNATVHGMVVEVSPIKASRKNPDVKYFSGKITDGKKAARVISLDPKLRSCHEKTGPPRKVVLGGELFPAIVGPHQQKPTPPNASAIYSPLLSSLHSCSLYWSLSHNLQSLFSLLSSLHISYLPLSVSLQHYFSFIICLNSACLSRTIFNLSSLCSAVSTSLISLCPSRSRALSVSYVISPLSPLRFLQLV